MGAMPIYYSAVLASTGGTSTVIGISCSLPIIKHILEVLYCETLHHTDTSEFVLLNFTSDLFPIKHLILQSIDSLLYKHAEPI